MGGISTIGGGEGDYFRESIGAKKSNFGDIKYKVNNENYLEVLNYVNGIKGLGKTADEMRPTFIGQEGAIYFVKFPDSNRGHIILDNIKFSSDEKLNKKLIEGLKLKIKK